MGLKIIKEKKPKKLQVLEAFRYVKCNIKFKQASETIKKKIGQKFELNKIT